MDIYIFSSFKYVATRFYSFCLAENYKEPMLHHSKPIE